LSAGASGNGADIGIIKPGFIIPAGLRPRDRAGTRRLPVLTELPLGFPAFAESPP
jgi:hypothetical protein